MLSIDDNRLVTVHLQKSIVIKLITKLIKNYTKGIKKKSATQDPKPLCINIGDTCGA